MKVSRLLDMSMVSSPRIRSPDLQKDPAVRPIKMWVRSVSALRCDENPRYDHAPTLTARARVRFVRAHFPHTPPKIENVLTMVYILGRNGGRYATTVDASSTHDAVRKAIKFFSDPFWRGPKPGPDSGIW